MRPIADCNEPAAFWPVYYPLRRCGADQFCRAFSFQLLGKECQVWASLAGKGGHNYLQYELGGQYQKRVKITGRNQKPIIIQAPGEGRHQVSIYKATDIHTRAIYIQKITGHQLASEKMPHAP